jgi:hypothetical protein
MLLLQNQYAFLLVLNDRVFLKILRQLVQRVKDFVQLLCDCCHIVFGEQLLLDIFQGFEDFLQMDPDLKEQFRVLLHCIQLVGVDLRLLKNSLGCIDGLYGALDLVKGSTDLSKGFYCSGNFQI